MSQLLVIWAALPIHAGFPVLFVTAIIIPWLWVNLISIIPKSTVGKLWELSPITNKIQDNPLPTIKLGMFPHL
jgi:hypothetical protein